MMDTTILWVIIMALGIVAASTPVSSSSSNNDYYGCAGGRDLAGADNNAEKHVIHTHIHTSTWILIEKGVRLQALRKKLW